MAKTILITGATRGIGQETARQLAKLGHRVIVGGRDEKQAQAVAKNLSPGTLAVQLDVADAASVARLADFLSENCPAGLDVLINNAGILRHQPMSAFDLDEISEVLEVNLFGALRVSKVALPFLKKSNDPRLIFVSSEMSQSERLRKGGSGAYRLSKSALNAVTLMLAAELPDVRVAAVSPGWVRTEMGGPGAPRSVGQGAASLVWCAVSPGMPSGRLWQDGVELPL